ncbi:MAG TPA: phosphate-starvation-inducible PsiE family protein [Hyphomicrobiaceae bacterium]|nr:phosphate-starvation-inducible PsiE family protein [Hyphomicrobiaceae bacterium]
MAISIEDPHADSTGPHVDLPPAVTRAGHAIGAWVRIILLTVIGAMTLVATVAGLIDIARAGKVTISDVLLMFIYLEIWAMIVIEATTRRLPVNFIIYIAITVLTRHLVGVAGDKSTSDIGLLIDAGAILVLAPAAVLLELRFFGRQQRGEPAAR